MEREPLRICGLTGVDDVTLDIAGPGSRSYAFVIDWHIRLLLGLAWFCGAWLLMTIFRAAPLQAPMSSSLARLAVAPAIIIYLLYHPVLEVLMRGRTPGKRRAGVRIVTRSGATPGPGALLIRNILRLVDALPILYVVGLASCFITGQRVRLGDLAAGTVLVLDCEMAATSRAQLGSMVTRTGLAPPLVQLIQDVLERWASLDTAKRDQLARSILARVDTAAPPAELASLNDAQLWQRLRQLLAFGRIERA